MFTFSTLYWASQRFISFYASQSGRKAGHFLNVLLFSRDPHGWTAAHHAAFRGHLLLLRFLLQSGQVDVNCRDFFSCTPLHRSCMGGNTEVTEYLLHKGASHEVRSSTGQSPLHLAAAGGHLGSARALLQNLAAPDLQDFHRWTPLHWAVCGGWGDMTELLLDNGADVEGVSGGGVTPLQLAVMVGSEAGVRLLLHRGADANLRGSSGRTALHLCACSAEKKVLSVLELELLSGWGLEIRSNAPLTQTCQFIFITKDKQLHSSVSF